MRARFRLFLLLALLLWPLAGQLAWAAPAAQRPRFIDPETVPMGRIRVAVLPFAVPADPSDLHILGEGMMESLLAGLQYVPTLVLVDRGRVERALKERRKLGLPDASALSGLGKVLNAQFIISGAVEPTSDGLRISVTITDVPTQCPHDLKPGAGPASAIFTLQAELAQRVLQNLHQTLTAEQQQRLTHALQATASLPAYRAYLLGRRAYLAATPASLGDAVQHFQDAVTADPADALAYAGLADTWNAWARLKLKEGEPSRTEYELAYVASRKALELNPNLPQAHRALGRAAGNLGRPGRGDEARRAVALNANDGESWYELWLADSALDPDHAYIRRAIELQPGLVDARVERGLALAGAGRFGEAVVEYDAALRFNPDLTYAHLDKGYALLSLGRFDEALAAYKEALRVDPKSAAAHASMGDALLGLKRLEDAETQLRAALALNPSHAVAHRSLGDLLATQDKKKEAIQEYELYLRFAPNARDETDVRERIRKLSWSL